PLYMLAAMGSQDFCELTGEQFYPYCTAIHQFSCRFNPIVNGFCFHLRLRRHRARQDVHTSEKLEQVSE
ncbi:MAG TPA: hypothetical protein VE821_01025, partial [Pyrinomonadaceae bacterium]|nr:hypothetical protein [Pyrinomonadaceae bacterium]